MTKFQAAPSFSQGFASVISASSIHFKTRVLRASVLRAFAIKGLLALLLLSPANALAQQKVAASPEELRKIIDQSMQAMDAGKLEEGLSLIERYSSLPSADMQVSLDGVRNQQPAILRRFGARMGSQFLRSEGLGDRLVRITVLERFEKSAITWFFVGYRGVAGWMIAGIRWTGDLESAFLPQPTAEH